MEKLLLGVISFLASAFFFPALAQTNNGLSCEFHLFAVDAGYQLPYRYDSPEVANSSTINPDTYYVYSFIIRSNTSDRKSLTKAVFQQVKGINEPLEILNIQPQNGTCQIDQGNKSATCNLDYSFTDSAHYPIEYLVKIKGSSQENTTSSLFSVTTTAGTTQCANWLRIKPAQTIINPILWETPYASLKSSDFYIRIGDQKFYGQKPVYIRSDPSLDKTTLEVTWQEKEVEMRLFLYFQKTANNMWELYEVRSYNGQAQGDWIYYQDSLGNKITSLIGSQNYAYERIFKPTNGQDAEIYCKGCSFNAFMPTVMVISDQGYSLKPLIGLPEGETITLSTDPMTGYGVNVLLLDKNQQTVLNQSGFEYHWSVDNAEIVALIPGTINYGNGSCAYSIFAPCPFNHVDLKGLKSGSARVKVAVVRLSDNQWLAETTFPVKVIEAAKLKAVAEYDGSSQVSVEEEELIKVKRDLDRLSQELAEQKQEVNRLRQIIDSIKQFLNRIFTGNNN